MAIVWRDIGNNDFVITNKVILFKKNTVTLIICINSESQLSLLQKEKQSFRLNTLNVLEIPYELGRTCIKTILTTK